MKPSLREQFERLAMRLNELDANLSDPRIVQDMTRWRALAKEQSDAATVVGHYRHYLQREQDLSSSQQMLQDPEVQSDPDMHHMAKQEAEQAQSDLDKLHTQLQAALLPKDPDDDRPAFLEIRAGTGGDESALFAGDLLRMYSRFAEQQGWKTEVMSESASDLGGYKEVVLRLEGQGAHQSVYGRLKFESGGHRVQRVPVTESQGRIHTSACTVAVMPEPPESQAITLNPADLRIDTFRASGAGGQHINKTDSAIRVTHLPTGLVAECQDDRSQHRNKAKALAVLQARLNDRERLERQAKEAAERKSLVGTGDRSDRIRTYNFPQGRLTDHRINLTLYKLLAIMEGDLDDVLTALQHAQIHEQLKQLEEG